MLTALVEPLGQALPATTEIVLHDLSRLPQSIVAVVGDVTGRKVGDPATDVLLEHLVAGKDGHLVGYSTRLPNGREMRSSTIIMRDSKGVACAAVCVNSDVSTWLDVRRLVDTMMGPRQGYGDMETAVSAAATRQPERNDQPKGETFAHDVEELAAHLIHDAITEVGIPVALMRKEHKMRVVARLQDRGLFLLRDGVETVASSLEVTRFTIYNYLNELADDPGKAQSDSGDDVERISARHENRPAEKPARKRA
jgi:predicted transcriptional regulator YheO